MRQTKYAWCLVRTYAAGAVRALCGYRGLCIMDRLESRPVS